MTNRRPAHLEFTSELPVSTDRAWQWITSMDGIRTEMMPIMRMSAPKGVQHITQVEAEPGQRMFRSLIFLFGVLPFDFSDLTMLELNPGVGFVEQSPMGTMKYWRHERLLEAIPIGTRLTDRLSFEPRLPPRGLSVWFVRRFFEHRHKQLRKHLR